MRAAYKRLSEAAIAADSVQEVRGCLTQGAIGIESEVDKRIKDEKKVHVQGKRKD